LGFLVKNNFIVGEIVYFSRKVASNTLTSKKSVIGALVMFHDLNWPGWLAFTIDFFSKPAFFRDLF
jgi:hypothetical protein